MALMEPYPGVSYDEVPWYRKTWFFMVLIFTIFPLAAVIVLSGDYYQRANRRQRGRSDAEVWRSTGSGRAFLFACAVGVGALGAAQYWAALSSQGTTTTGRSTLVADSTGPRASTTTTVAPTTTLPGSEGLPEFIDELRALGIEAFSSQDPTQAIGALSDRFGDLPAVGNVALASFSVSTSGHTGPSITHHANLRYSTDLAVAAAAAEFRSAKILEIPVSSEESSITEAGEEVEFEYSSRQTPHPDPEVDRATSFVTIEDTDAGVSVTISAFISLPGPLDNGPSTRLAELFPIADGYDIDDTSIGFLTIEPMATTPSFSISMETTSTQPLASTDDAAEAARFADAAEAGGLWARSESAQSELEVLRRLDGAIDGRLFISGSQSNEMNIVRVSLRTD